MACFPRPCSCFPDPLTSLQDVGPQDQGTLNWQVPHSKIASALGKERWPPVGTVLEAGKELGDGKEGFAWTETSQVACFPDPFQA